MEGPSSKNFVSTVVILLVITCYFRSSSAKRHICGKSTTEFIESSCGVATYPSLCISSLSRHANAIQNSPKLLANTSLSVTLETAKSTSKMMLSLTQSHKLHPKEATAMTDCVEEISDSVDELQKALGEMSQLKRSEFQLMMNDIETWVSAALTNQDTCNDGFTSNAVNGELKNVMQERILHIARLTSNALALVNNYASLHG